MEAIRGSQKSLTGCKTIRHSYWTNDIPERFKIDDRELSLKEMSELAKSFDLKAKATKISENELLKLPKKQQILKLKNGRYIIA